jgi:hypothetical protein
MRRGLDVFGPKRQSGSSEVDRDMERFHRTDERPLSRPSFTGKSTAWVFLCLVAAAYCFSNLLLDRTPLAVAVFRGGDAPQAYLVTFYFNGREPLVVETNMTASQKHELSRSILTTDDETLSRLSKTVGAEGRYAASSSGGTSTADWPLFFGGGFAALTRLDPPGWVCSLTFPERFVLACWAKIPPAAPWNPSSTTSEESAQVPSIAVKPPTAKVQTTAPPVDGTGPASIQASGAVSSQEPLRVEIRNGCGITNAADAVARAAKDAGMKVMFVGNAEGPGRFRVPKTFIESHSGVPVALEEFCRRLGIPTGDVRQNAASKSGVDVTVTVGRDYLKLREHLRDRSQR